MRNIIWYKYMTHEEQKEYKRIKMKELRIKKLYEKIKEIR